MGLRSPVMVDDYAARLERWIEAGDVESLLAAGEMGRQAVDDGVGMMEMTELHLQSLARVLERPSARQDPARAVRCAGAFLCQSLRPYESIQRSLAESNSSLAQSNADLARSNANLRRLNQRFEDEAKRVSHAIHAEAGQLLASAAIALDRIRRELPTPGRDLVADVTVLLDQIHDELRRLSHELRPPMLDQLGLLPALRFLAEGVSQHSGIAVRVLGELPRRPPAAVETAIYRSVQEALHNTVEHAACRAAEVRVWREPGLWCCSVRDDGRGFEPGALPERPLPRGLGLAGIRERLHDLGGKLLVESAPGRGTALVIQIPMEE